MLTTWQKMLAIFIGIIFGLVVGYICIKHNIENASVPTTENTSTNDVFDQYLNNNESNIDNNSIENNIESTNTTMED